MGSYFDDAMPGSHSVPLSGAVAASSPLSRDLRVAMIDSNAKLPTLQNVDTNAIPDQRVSSITPATVRFFKGASLPRFSLSWLGLDSARDVVVDISWINENHASIMLHVLRPKVDCFPSKKRATSMFSIGETLSQCNIDTQIGNHP